MGNSPGKDNDGTANTATAGSTTTDTDAASTRAGAGAGPARRGRPRTATEDGKRIRSTLEGDLVDAPLPTLVSLPDEPAKKTRRKKKDPTPGITPDAIVSLITAGSSIAATRTSDIWRIDADEAKLIADPLADILNKMDFIKGHSDEARLAFAVIVVLGPRVIMQIQTADEKPSEERAQKPNGNEKRTTTSGPIQRGGEPDTTTPSDSASHTPAVFPVIS